jgi:hypothetical protein
MAYVLAAKYRCDPGIAHNAATIRLALQASCAASADNYLATGADHALKYG